MTKFQKRERKYSGTKTNAVSEREIKNRQTAKKAAAEGMVLLKNEGVLPLEKGQKVALYGGGAVHTIKGGTGSGDVNERESVSIYQGFLDAGIELTNREWLDSYDRIYRQAREDWKNEILDDAKKHEQTRFFYVYAKHVFRMPTGDKIEKADVAKADVVFYVISRTAGEGADRFLQDGDYYLTEKEKEDLAFLNDHTKKLVVILNTGGVIDLQYIMGLSNLKGLMSIVQPGMEGGHALADLVTGVVTPSGKLTSTWVKAYEDIPFGENYSHNNGVLDKEYYKEGIYVGYRYFDSFRKDVAYPFGYGLSYTSFSIHADEFLPKENGEVEVKATVTNTGSKWSGKEVVQVYVSCPQDGMEKEYRRLCGFAKTKLLKPGESEQVCITIPAKNFASFSEEKSAWVVEAGNYGLWIGNSSKDLTVFGILNVEKTVILEKVKAICPLKENLDELSNPKQVRLAREAEWKKEAAKKKVPVLTYLPKPEVRKVYKENEAARIAKEIAGKLTTEQMILMVVGEISKGHDQAIGAAGIMVPGAAGETSSCLEEEYGIPGVPMADGPAGLRLMKSYEVDRKTGLIYSQGFLGAMEGGIFADHTPHENADTYYQYATAIPVGTLLAQTWDPKLLMEVGRAVATEMEEFGIGWWLAPGMNIHRNPLCGRNFEYYSEDPLLSGTMAAAITKGVQSGKGVGTTIKHFACNNQEDNRMGCNSIVSQRALREIYLRGFEIAVKEAQPMAIMTSYNLINGVHTANSKDLCTVVAREEWNFQGLIMTDWTTTMPHGGSKSWQCVAAGNDLIMPGYKGDIENIKNALEDGSLKKEELQDCVERLLKVILQTNAFENARPYGEQFLEL
ncbi:MAG: Fn3-like domain-containing protein [Lachnoclostridium sp.]|jgi:beta-glucosidase